MRHLRAMGGVLLAAALLLAGCEPPPSGTPEEDALRDERFPEKVSAEWVEATYLEPYGRMLCGLQGDWTSPEQLKADEVLAWSFYYPQYPDAGREPEGEKYGEGIYSQEPYGYLFSQEEVEAYTAQRFGMTAEQTRAAFSYLPARGAYAILPYDKTEQYVTALDRFDIRGDTIDIEFFIFKSQDGTPQGKKRLTARVAEDGGFRYLSCVEIDD